MNTFHSLVQAIAIIVILRNLALMMRWPILLTESRSPPLLQIIRVRPKRIGATSRRFEAAPIRLGRTHIILCL